MTFGDGSTVEVSDALAPALLDSSHQGDGDATGDEPTVGDFADGVAAEALARVPTGRAPRNLTWWRLAMITFVFTCTGPGGLEEVVAAGGPILALAGLLIVPVIYVMPQIFVVAEMGAMMPTSAGNVVWVHRAFGRFAGFYNAWIFAVTNMVDMAVYPVLFGDYAATTIFGSNAPWGAKMGLRIGGLALTALISLLSAKSVSNVSAIGCAVIVIFVGVVFFAASPHMDYHEQFNYVEKHVDWSLLGSSLLWLYTGWAALGSMAGETKSPKTLLHGMSVALVVDVSVYVMTLFAAMTHAKRGEWHDGYLVHVFNRIVPGIGPYFGAGVTVAALALSLSALLCYSRSVWGIAKMGWAPRVLTKQLKTGAPHASVAAHAAIVFCLIWSDFGFIVQVEYTVAAASYIITYWAFLKLRYSEPDAPRPYVVPGGKPFAWLLTLMKTALMGATCVAGLVQDWRIAVAFGGVNAAVLVAYAVLRRLRPEDAPVDALDVDPDAVIVEVTIQRQT